ncbi:hypothetical protein BY458DRAFT_505777 [Sporodiniella umbellata]|nr:hypothetical protein BY458DRAFT_505777 [Sporodiniella umbellata]
MLVWLLESANLNCQHRLYWLPIFIKVYIIGVVETIIIAIYRRGLFFDQTSEKSIEEKKALTAVITGGDSGIGLEITKSLIEAHYHVIIGTRCKEQCHRAIEPFLGNKGTVSIFELDLANFDSVHAFAFEVVLEAAEIDVLINNAGVMNVPYFKTVDGYESQCQINYLSPILLTQLLLPCMNKLGSRILFASSSTLYAMNDLNTSMPFQSYKLDGLEHYAYSKACIAHLAQYMSTIIPNKTKIYSYHPGTVRTRLFDHTTVFKLKLFSKLFDFIMLTPKEGSQTPVYLCLSDYVQEGSTYWADRRPQPLTSVWVNKKKNDLQHLWEDTLIKIKLDQNNSE